MSDDLVRAIIELREENADLRARFERLFRPGVVTDVDAAKGVYRQEIGVDPETGAPLKSAWIPYSQAAGARKSHSPPSVGQQMMHIAPDGDHAQAFGMPLGWSNANASPSQRADEDVDARGQSKDTTRGDLRKIEVGGASIEVTPGAVKITAGGATLTISGGKIALTGDAEFSGGKVSHNGHDIGETHQHVGVRSGSSLTGRPQ